MSHGSEQAPFSLLIMAAPETSPPTRTVSSWRAAKGMQPMIWSALLWLEEEDKDREQISIQESELGNPEPQQLHPPFSQPTAWDSLSSPPLSLVLPQNRTTSQLPEVLFGGLVAVAPKRK